MPPVIREAQIEDRSGMIELERLSPEMGRAAVRLEMRVDHFSLAARYPNAKGYVALDSVTSAIIGMIFSSAAPTQINDHVMPAAYLFSLRVHPEYRRQGIATRLIDHACERASAETGARAFWAAIIEGNDASLRTFQRANFARLRDLSVRIVLGGLALPRRLPNLSIRPATTKDLPALADALNRHFAHHNFWRLKTSEQLRTDLAIPLHSLEDTVVAFEKDGTVLAAASAVVMARLTRLHLLGFGFLPERANRFVAPVSERNPMNVILVRNYVFPYDRPEIGAVMIQALHRRYLPRSIVAVVTVDPLDPSWQALQRLLGITGHLHLVARSAEPIDQARLAYFH